MQEGCLRYVTETALIPVQRQGWRIANTMAPKVPRQLGRWAWVPLSRALCCANTQVSSSLFATAAPIPPFSVSPVISDATQHVPNN